MTQKKKASKFDGAQLAGISLVAKKPAWATAIMAFKYDHKWMIFCKNWNPKSYSFWGNVNLVILCSKPRGLNWVALLGQVWLKLTVRMISLMKSTHFSMKWHIIRI